MIDAYQRNASIIAQSFAFVNSFFKKTFPGVFKDKALNKALKEC